MTDTTQTAPEAPAAASPAAPTTLLGDAAVQAPADPQPAPSPAPETPPVPDYSSLAFPEGVAVDAALMETFKGLAGEHGLSAEGAQKLMDLHMQTIEAQQVSHQQMISGWAQAVAQDSEIGGANQAQAVGLAKQALSTFGTPALLDALNQSGLGNHPEVIRAFYRMGKATSEDGRQAQANSAAVDPLRALYPSMFE